MEARYEEPGAASVPVPESFHADPESVAAPVTTQAPSDAELLRRILGRTVAAETQMASLCGLIEQAGQGEPHAIRSARAMFDAAFKSLRASLVT